MLDSPEMPVSVVVRRFERRLLEHLGAGLDWERAADGQPIDPEWQYRVGLQGGIVPGNGANAVSGRLLRAIARDEALTEAVDRRRARDLMQGLLAPHVGSAPFLSRRLWPSTRDSTQGPDAGDPRRP